MSTYRLYLVSRAGDRMSPVEFQCGSDDAAKRAAWEITMGRMGAEVWCEGRLVGMMSAG